MPRRLERVVSTPAFADEHEYERELEQAQLRLLLVQRHLHATGRRAVILLEGRDASGKGGAILRMVQRLDPRGYAVHPIGPPEPWEAGRHHLERFFDRLPRPRTLAIHDRSWYGRVLVERVEKLCPEKAWKRAYSEINELEKWLVDDGVPVLKFMLHVSKKEQLRRFEERRDDPFKSWKLTRDDWRAREKWSEYGRAFEDMLAKTDTERAPWHVVAADRKWRARVEVVATAADVLSGIFGCACDLPRGWRVSKA